MKISTKGRYAVRILLDIAMHQGDGYVAMRDIARRQQISKKYADQIAMQLGQSCLLSAVRGHTGGYRLMIPASDITILQVITLMEGNLTPVACMDQEPNPCPRCNYCMTLPVWQGLEKVISDYLGSITLQDLVDRGPEQPELEDMSVPT